MYSILYIVLFLTVFIIQLTQEQRVFLVTAWMRSKSYQVVSQEFSENFPERNVLNKTTIWKNVKKYREEGTSLNLNRRRSGKMKIKSQMLGNRRKRTIANITSNFPEDL